MINDIRNTVLAVLNKNNYGYISPQDFNLYAQQAQMDLFEDYFYAYNYQVNKENQRTSGTGYADIKKGYVEVIDFFSVTKPLIPIGPNYTQYNLPSLATTGSDYYLINKIVINNTLVTSGTTTGTLGGQNKIVDSNANFTSSGVQVGDIVFVVNLIPFFVTVTNIDSNTQLNVTPSVINNFPLDYQIYKGSTIKEVERVEQSKITLLNMSPLTAPSSMFPAYTSEGNVATLYPTPTLGTVVTCQYIRYPKVPKWTYVDLGNDNEPVFDQSQPDYQDFELFPDDATDLTMKILQYAGVSIREASVVQYAGAKEAAEINSEK
mgnify:CR=1 FL=1|jgi:hypothetical protein